MVNTELITPCPYEPRQKELFRPFIYALIDPAEPSHVRYVGLTLVNPRRPYDHVKEARKERGHSHLLHWIRLLLARGTEPAVLILEELPAGAGWNLVCFVEKCYIKSLREIGHRLTNVSAGGDGNTSPCRQETKALLSAMNKGKPSYERTDATRARNAAGNLGRVRSAEAREKNRLAHLGVVPSLESIEKTAAANRGSKRTPEVIGKIREKALEMHADAVSGHAGMLGKSHSPQTRETMHKVWSDPEKRAAHSALMKASWARRKAEKNGR